MSHLFRSYGYFASRTLPQWKTEGYCEYGVNQLVAPGDPGYTIPERIDIYLDDASWNPAAAIHRPHYVWGLMMEFLVRVRGYNFQQLMSDSVEYEKTLRAMMQWRKTAGTAGDH
ncbi:MAG TPA: hypothetical protein P5531_03010 [Bacteroidales bacterium]|nr:hypothetical protein [Bacteroidales bacterium]HSA42511.1 hypothetical protein [Bacteroidales bacterium]